MWSWEKIVSVVLVLETLVKRREHSWVGLGNTLYNFQSTPKASLIRRWCHQGNLLDSLAAYFLCDALILEEFC